MAMTDRPIVVGVFRDRTLAKQAIDELRHVGLRDDEISVDGHARGGLLDHLAKALTEHEAADAGLSHQLVSKGVPKDEADYYQQELEAGRTVVLVESYAYQQEARDILHRFGAYDASTRRQEGDRTIPVREEVLRVHKQVVATGEIVIRKEVLTEQKTFTIPVTREELVIERGSGSDQPSDQPVYEGETSRVPIREEQVTVEKQPVETGEVAIGKRQAEETKRVSDTVRREEAQIEREGDVDIQGTDGEEGSS